MWGTRVVIPKVHQQKVQEELHGGHLGVVKMKALARSHVWCPHIDKGVILHLVGPFIDTYVSN